MQIWKDGPEVSWCYSDVFHSFNYAKFCICCGNQRVKPLGFESSPMVAVTVAQAQCHSHHYVKVGFQNDIYLNTVEYLDQWSPTRCKTTTGHAGSCSFATAGEAQFGDQWSRQWTKI